MWADGTPMPLPSDEWNHWYCGEPDDSTGEQDCSVISNYRFWSIRKLILDNYVWLDYSCNSNPQDVQGYICESKFIYFDKFVSSYFHLAFMIMLSTVQLQ